VTFNQRVVGSIPTGLTNKIKYLKENAWAPGTRRFAGLPYLSRRVSRSTSPSGSGRKHSTANLASCCLRSSSLAFGETCNIARRLFGCEPWRDNLHALHRMVRPE
jgi:hypothetical protein